MMQATLLEADLDIKAANQSSSADDANQEADHAANHQQLATKVPVASGDDIV